MGWYCFVTFASALVLFGIRHLLLRDASNSRISKAADYVPVVEVRVRRSLFLLFLSRCSLLCCWLRCCASEVHSIFLEFLVVCNTSDDSRITRSRSPVAHRTHNNRPQTRTICLFVVGVCCCHSAGTSCYVCEATRLMSAKIFYPRIQSRFLPRALVCGVRLYDLKFVPKDCLPVSPCSSLLGIDGGLLKTDAQDEEEVTFVVSHVESAFRSIVQQ